MSNPFPQVGETIWVQDPSESKALGIPGDNVGWNINYLPNSTYISPLWINPIDDKIETAGISYWIRKCYSNGGGTVAFQQTAANGNQFWVLGVST